MTRPPDDSPFLQAHFQRTDETAIAALRAHYARIFPARDPVLDLMRSCVSHFPGGFVPSRAAGLGMNANELATNSSLTERTVHDPNREPALPYDAMSFDAVVMAVSVQYLQRPIDVFRKIGLGLRPNGICAVSFSNPCFPSKTIVLWTSTGDAAHLQIVEAYFHHAGGFRRLESRNLSPNPGSGDRSMSCRIGGPRTTIPKTGNTERASAKRNTRAVAERWTATSRRKPPGHSSRWS